MSIRTGKLLLTAVLAGTVGLAGCANNGPGYGTRSGYGYQGASAPAPCQNCGVVTDVQQVYVQDGGHGTLGAVLGAVAGAALGHQVGGGKGKQAATVAGAVAGGVAGHEIGKRTGEGQQLAWQVSMRLDDGQPATVTQREDPGLRVGDRAQIRGDHVYALR